MADQPIFPEQRLSIITLGVIDRAAMTRFYETALGFKNVGPKQMAMFDLGGFILGLWEADKLAGDAGLGGGRPDGFNVWRWRTMRDRKPRLMRSSPAVKRLASRLLCRPTSHSGAAIRAIF